MCQNKDAGIRTISDKKWRSYNEDTAWQPIFDEGVVRQSTFVRAFDDSKDVAWQLIFSEGMVWRPAFVGYNEDTTWQPIFDEGVAW